MTKASIFLSYAREDDERFVWRLYNDLTARGFVVWFDRQKIPSRGRPFPIELGEAIEKSDRFVLVVSPGTVTSAWCRAEWQYADILGRTITPVVRMDGERPDGVRIDGFELLPEEIKRQELHADDFRDDERYQDNFELLVQQLSEDVVPAGKLIGIPALPVHLVARYDRVSALRDALLSDFQHPVGITGVYGMGGIGKSVLANLLARDPRVRRSFCDGVFWVPIGIQAEVLQRQVELARALGYAGSCFESTEEGRTQLSELLAPKSVLLVLDNVWTRESVEAFNVLGPKCRVVLTTRDSGLVISLGGKHYQLEPLADVEALSVLAQAAHVEVEALPEEAREIVRRCGHLPLALALSGGIVRRGIAWEGVLRRLERGALEHIGDQHPDPANSHHQSISTALRVSVDALSDNERQRFLELSIFPLGAEVPEVAACTLWSYTGGLDEFSCEELLVSLRERSLLLASRSNEIAFHDLVHAFASKEAGETSCLHDQLLNAYRTKCSHGWPSGPNDGYFLQNIVKHLLAANRTDEAVALLTDLSWIRINCCVNLLYELTADIRSTQSVLSRLPSVPLERQCRNAELDNLRATLGRSAQHIEHHPARLVPVLYNELVWNLPQDSSLAEQLRSAAEEQKGPWLRRPRPAVLGGSPGLTRPLMTMHHDDSVNVVAFSPCGELIASTADCAVYLWSIETGQLLKQLALDRTAYALAFSQDGRKLAAGTYTGTVRLWRVHDGRVLHEMRLEGHNCAVRTVAFSPSGETLVAAGCDQPRHREQRVYVWEVESGELVRTFAGNQGGINALAFSPDGRFLASVGQDRWLRLWRFLSGEPYRAFDVHRRYNETLAYSPDGRTIASGGHDNLVRVWDIETGERLPRLKGHSDKVSSVIFAPQGHIIGSASDDSTIRLWDFDTGELRGVLEGHTGFVHSIAFSPSGDMIASGSFDKRMHVWRLDPTGSHSDVSTHKGYLSVAVAHDGKLLGSAAGRDNCARIWRTESGELWSRLVGHSGGVYAIAFSPDGETICTGGRDGKVRLWKLTGELLLVLAKHSEAVHCIAYSPDGRILASAGDRDVQLSSTKTGKCRSSFKRGGAVRALAFSPNGSMIAFGGQEGMQICKIKGEHLVTFRGHSSWFSAAVFSPDGRILCASDSFIHFVNVNTKEHWKFYPNEWGVKLASEACAVAYHPDGNLLATGHWDGSVRIWDIEASLRTRNLVGCSICRIEISGRACFLRWDREVGLQVGAAIGSRPALHVFELV